MRKISLKYFVLEAMTWRLLSIGQEVTTNIFLLVPFSFFQILSYYLYGGVPYSHLIIYNRSCSLCHRTLLQDVTILITHLSLLAVWIPRPPWSPLFQPWFQQTNLRDLTRSLLLNGSPHRRPTEGSDKHRLQTLKQNERPVQIWNHLPRAKVENYRATLRGHGDGIQGSTAAIWKMVPFWTAWFHLPARVPNLEPGSKWQSYRIRAWKYKCLISHGLDFVCNFKSDRGQNSPIFSNKRSTRRFAVFTYWGLHSCMRSFIKYGLTYIPPRTSRRAAQAPNGREWIWISTVRSPGKAGRILLWARPKMPFLPGWLFHYLLSLSWETLPLVVTWSK